MVFKLISTFFVILLIILITFLPSNVHLGLHNICFVNVFNSFIPVIMQNTPRFKSSILFGTHTLLDKLLRLLELPKHLSNLTSYG